MTQSGGVESAGAIFEMTNAGVISIVGSFAGSSGVLPVPGGLTQATNGALYAVTRGGGSAPASGYVCPVESGCGSIVNISLGIPQFIQLLPSYSEVVHLVLILGSGLSGVTEVTFNGVPATFSIVSASEISTKVPSGATTGPVEVFTANGTMISNSNFVVTRSSR